MIFQGVDIRTSPLVPEGQILRSVDAFWFHSRLSVRARKRRAHGRPRNHPRHWKVDIVRYQPDLDRLLEVVAR